MLRVLAVMCALTCLFTPPAFASWDVLESRWRPDANPFADEQVWEDFYWAEGWDHPEQFYPHHFEPAGSLHVVLKNGSTTERNLTLTHIDSQPIDEATTTPTRTARVIVRVLADHLAIACPVPGEYRHRHAWVSSLMAGPDTMVIIVVNKRYHIAYNTVGHQSVHRVARDVELSVPVPAHFADCTVQEVHEGRLVSVSAGVENGRLKLALDAIETARAFVVKSNR